MPLFAWTVLMITPALGARKSHKLVPNQDELLNTFDRVHLAGLCVIDLHQAIAYLGYAGVAIDSAAKGGCAGGTPNSCAAVASKITSQFLASAYFLTLTASSCTQTENVNAQISGNLILTWQAFSAIAAAASAMTYHCDGDFLSIPGKLLASQLSQTQRNNMIASCVFDINVAANYFARAVLTLKNAAEDCPRQAGKPLKCTVKAGTIFVSVSWIATFVSLAANNCPFAINFQAACAADVAAVVAAATELVGIGVEMARLFPPVGNLAPTIPMARRLQNRNRDNNASTVPDWSIGRSAGPPDVNLRSLLWSDPLAAREPFPWELSTSALVDAWANVTTPDMSSSLYQRFLKRVAADRAREAEASFV